LQHKLMLNNELLLLDNMSPAEKFKLFEQVEARASPKHRY
jgi:hypothetical protein